VAYATQGNKSWLREDPATCGVVEYACKEKAPQCGGALPKALDFGFAVSATAQCNLLAFS
jgi:hypothetical protein